MKAALLRIRRFHLSRKLLEELSDADRELFFLAGHVLNELNSLNNIVAWCLRSGSMADAGVCGMARGAQAMIYARLLAGKVLEAWEVLRTTWFARKPSQAFDMWLHPESAAALAEIKGYFSRTNLLYTIRNSFAFHYSPGEIPKHWTDFVDGDHMQLILGGAISNNMNLAAESLVNASVLRAAHPTDLEAGMERFVDEVHTMASHFNTFFEGVTLVLLRQMIGENFIEQGAEETISVESMYKDVRIPYFCALD